jgi:hypothetical protein
MQLETVQQTPGHAVAQVPPQVKLPTQPAGETTVQAPVVVLQHLPRQGLGEHEPQKKVLGAEQEACVAPVVQAHVEALQQTPVHGLGVQTLAGPWYAPPAAHPPMRTAEQAQLVSQQTPGQTVAQVPPQVKLPTQAAGATTVHAPVVVLQHLPVQGLGVQVPQTKVLGAVQVAAVAPVVQAHVVAMQQTPVQGLGVQVPPHVKMLGAMQEAVVAPLVQVQVVELQQMPTQGLGVQVPLQMKVLGAVQVTAEAPAVQAQVLALQQTPAHGLGVQVVLQMKEVPAPTQRPWLS